MRQLALVAALVFAAACATPEKRTYIGAGAGAAAGTALGAAVGGWKGAVVGGVTGAVAGGAAGNILDRQAAELKQRAADTKRTADGILVRLKEDLLFKVDSAQLKPGAVQELSDVGDILAKYEENHIEIRGYTDSTGSERHNEELSQRRAEAVRRVFVSRGVKEAQMLAIGMGESEPVASNDTRDGRAKNRRVELKIALIQR